MLLKFFWSTKCLILESIAFALLRLADIPSIGDFQVKFSSIFTPRYFTEFVVCNLFLLSLSFKPKLSWYFFRFTYFYRFSSFPFKYGVLPSA